MRWRRVHRLVQMTNSTGDRQRRHRDGTWRFVQFLALILALPIALSALISDSILWGDEKETKQAPKKLDVSNVQPLPKASKRGNKSDLTSLAYFEDDGLLTKQVQLTTVNEEEELRTASSAREAESAPAPPPCKAWPKPDLALFLTGRQDGYIEPCGCTGLENAKGGLSRRSKFYHQLLERGWDVVPLDVGNQVDRFGVQAELKFQTTVDTLRAMDYAAIGFGPNDLRLSIGNLAVAIGESDEAHPAIFVCANADILGMNAKYRIIEKNGLRVGVTSILGTREREQINSDEIILSDPDAALRLVLAELKQQACTHLILLAHASLDESRELAKKFQEFSLIITGGGSGEPTQGPEEISGARAPMLQVGTKGMYVGVVGLYEQPRRGFRYERVVLDARFPDDPDVLDAFSEYQRQLKSLGLPGLGIRPVKHPQRGRTFVGHEVCGECHTKALAVFEGTPHFHATDSISQPTQRSNIPRHFDPECLSCHVTGWNPQGHYPYQTGYLDLEKSVHLHGNGCENCHGPGSQHVAAENGDVEVTEAQIEAFRAAMRLDLAKAENVCVECHDTDNSPDFKFDAYWEQVKHEGVD
jgi:Cytochrome c554 and c-prime